MHTQYLTGESFHSPLLKPEAMCSPQQTEHDLPFSCSLWLRVSTWSMCVRTRMLAYVYILRMRLCRCANKTLPQYSGKIQFLPF